MQTFSFNLWKIWILHASILIRALICQRFTVCLVTKWMLATILSESNERVLQIVIHNINHNESRGFFSSNLCQFPSSLSHKYYNSQTKVINTDSLSFIIFQSGVIVFVTKWCHKLHASNHVNSVFTTSSWFMTGVSLEN